MCAFLMERGFKPYRIAPDRNNPLFDVYLFTATPELYDAVMEYVATNTKENIMNEGEYVNDGEETGKI